MNIAKTVLTLAAVIIFSGYSHSDAAKEKPLAAPFTIDADFPGGNVKVEKIEGDSVQIAPDQRTNRLPWFYWYFRVSNAGGRTLNFDVDARNMGVRGPGVSLDKGVTWKWLGADKVQGGAFSYTFPAGANDVRFSVGMPYVRSNFDAFLARHKGNPFLQVGTLTKSNKGRDVVMVHVGDPKKKARYAIAVTARNHACEMMASYVVEGLLEGILADDATGRALRENADFLFVPFMDTDGVEDGDQGKNRAPHDHNRDYTAEPIYAEVKALMKQVPEWSDGRPLLFFDIHDPALKTDIHETIHFIEPYQPDMAARMNRLTSLLERDQQGTIGYTSANTMRAGTGYNSPDGTQAHAAAWSRRQPNTLLGCTIEVPYANAFGYEVNQDSARGLGRDFAIALKDLLNEKPETIAAKKP